MIRRTTLAITLLGMLLPANPSTAGKADIPPGWREGNNAKILPKYCQDRLDKHGRWTKWRDYFGPVYVHMHHYCSGIYGELMAQQTIDKKKREYWVRQAVSEMNYVSPHCDPSCVLYADLHRRLAWGLSQQGRHEEATKHYQLMGAAKKSARAP